MMMTATVGIGRPVLAPLAFLGNAGALTGGGSGLCGRPRGRPFVAAIGAYHLMVYFTGAAVGFTAVACHAEQLYVAAVVSASARKGGDVVELQAGRTTAALANATIAGKDGLFGGLRHISALRKAR